MHKFSLLFEKVWCWWRGVLTWTHQHLSTNYNLPHGRVVTLAFNFSYIFLWWWETIVRTCLGAWFENHALAVVYKTKTYYEAWGQIVFCFVYMFSLKQKSFDFKEKQIYRNQTMWFQQLQGEKHSFFIFYFMCICSLVSIERKINTILK